MGYSHRMETEIELKDGADIAVIRQALEPLLDEFGVDMEDVADDLGFRNSGNDIKIEREGRTLKIQSWGEASFDFGEVLNGVFEKVAPHAAPFSVSLYDHDDNDTTTFMFANSEEEYDRLAIKNAVGGLLAARFGDISPETLERAIRGAIRTARAAAAGPDEDTLTAFMSQRIENGDLAPDDIPRRLARYGMMDPAEFIGEMEERMEMLAADAAADGMKA